MESPFGTYEHPRLPSLRYLEALKRAEEREAIADAEVAWQQHYKEEEKRLEQEVEECHQVNIWYATQELFAWMWRTDDQ